MYGTPRATVAHALAALTVALALPAAAAPAVPALARERHCMNCHALDHKVVGPAFEDVAKRYAGQGAMLPKLAAKVVRGGGGAWGPVPMPANPQVTPDEARQLVAWVLSLR
ncbi:MAG: c-type cytochrome [Burkholderiales bacterium]|nr:c-type cytochrome [Burkholderiales bacterium]MDE1927158.1 c-type cytochrome [Burkholderiales bacterium]MDE2158907.1 c-type cytochrome [Burkholderiales bacterium]